MALSYTTAAATPTTITVAGTRVFLGTTATDPTTDTYTEIGGVLTIPSFGPSDAEVKVECVNQPVQRAKGSTDYGATTMTSALDRSDAGQIALKAAQGVKTGNYNLRLVFPDGVSGRTVLTSASHGTLVDVKVQVATAMEKRDGPNNVVTLETNLFVNSAPTITAAT